MKFRLQIHSSSFLAEERMQRISPSVGFIRRELRGRGALKIKKGKRVYCFQEQKLGEANTFIARNFTHFKPLNLVQNSIYFVYSTFEDLEIDFLTLINKICRLVETKR